MMFLLGFILFCAQPRLMGFIWLHIFHLPRGLVGFLLLQNLPKSHEIVHQLQIPDQSDGSHYNMESIVVLLKQTVSKIFIRYVESCRKYMLSYVILTWLAMVIDIIEFLVHFIRFGYKGDEHSDLAMLFLTIIFLALDVFYLVWALGAKEKFPGDISNALTKALFGKAEEISLSLAETAKNKKSAIGKMLTRGMKRG